jgi:hypothetical protein
MAIADTEAPTKGGWLRRSWEMIATVIAVIVLVDLSSLVVKWAKLIHEIAEKYAAARTWLFGLLPWPIQPEWHDPVVLFLIFFSLTNVGLYRSRKHTIVSYILRNLEFVNILSVATVMIIASALFLPQAVATDFIKGLFEKLITILTIIFIFIALLFGYIVLSFAATVLAWRWLLTTAAIFCVLIAINQAYVVWLEPLVEHH